LVAACDYLHAAIKTYCDRIAVFSKAVDSAIVNATSDALLQVGEGLCSLTELSKELVDNAEEAGDAPPVGTTLKMRIDGETYIVEQETNVVEVSELLGTGGQVPFAMERLEFGAVLTIEQEAMIRCTVAILQAMLQVSTTSTRVH